MAALADPVKAVRWHASISPTSPTLEEILQAINRLNTGRSPGVKGLEADLLRFGSDDVAPVSTPLSSDVGPWVLPR